MNARTQCFVRGGVRFQLAMLARFELGIVIHLLPHGPTLPLEGAPDYSKLVYSLFPLYALYVNEVLSNFHSIPTKSKSTRLLGHALSPQPTTSVFRK